MENSKFVCPDCGKYKLVKLIIDNVKFFEYLKKEIINMVSLYSDYNEEWYHYQQRLKNSVYFIKLENPKDEDLNILLNAGIETFVLLSRYEIDKNDYFTFLRYAIDYHISPELFEYIICCSSHADKIQKFLSSEESKEAIINLVLWEFIDIQKDIANYILDVVVPSFHPEIKEEVIEILRKRNLINT